MNQAGGERHEEGREKQEELRTRDTNNKTSDRMSSQQVECLQLQHQQQVEEMREEKPVPLQDEAAKGMKEAGTEREENEEEEGREKPAASCVVCSLFLLSLRLV